MSIEVEPQKSRGDKPAQWRARWLARYLRLVFRTSRLVNDLPPIYRQLEKNEPFILAGWHGSFLLAPLLFPHPERISAVVARHGDAELMGTVLEEFGVGLIRGAGAGGKKKDKGGAHALRASLRALKNGQSIAITADVPPGPARKAGPGVVTLAKLSGRPIVPVAVVSSRFHVLNNWSRFMVNLPFSRLAVDIGEPLYVPRDADTDSVEKYRLELQARLDEVVERMHRLAGADPARSAAARVGRAPAPGLSLKSYRAVMSLLRPIAGPLLRRRARHGKEDPARLPERLGHPSLPRPGDDGSSAGLIWLHAASVGETNAVMPLIETLQKRQPRPVLLLTTGTVTSAKIAQKRLPDGVLHQFIPLDAPQYMASFLDHWRPSLAVLVESEIWPNLVMEAYERQIPLVLVNGTLSSKSYKSWRRRPGMSRAIFGRFTLVLAQNVILQKRFLRLGTPDVRVVGNLKFDAPRLPCDQQVLEELRAATRGRPLFLAASTHPGEEEQVIAAHKLLQQRFGELLTIILPRHPDRGEAVEAMVKDAGLKARRRSKDQTPSVDCSIYIADTLGETGLFYALCPVTFMGGSLCAIGGHNPIEAVRFGTVVLTGPTWHNQADAFSALIKGGGALEVSSDAGLAEEVAELLGNEEKRLQIRRRADTVVGELTGAVSRSLQALEALLPGGDALAEDQEQIEKNAPYAS